jgi:hypothetical protein
MQLRTRVLPEAFRPTNKLIPSSPNGSTLHSLGVSQSSLNPKRVILILNSPLVPDLVVERQWSSQTRDSLEARVRPVLRRAPTGLICVTSDQLDPQGSKPPPASAPSSPPAPPPPPPAAARAAGRGSRRITPRGRRDRLRGALGDDLAAADAALALRAVWTPRPRSITQSAAFTPLRRPRQPAFLTSHRSAQAIGPARQSARARRSGR